jgi:predicted AAA+ superfamily ATPase
MDALMKPVSRLANPVEWNGMKFRSKLESLVARELLKLKIQFVHELEGFSDGETLYLPDFYLPQQDCLLEVKPREYLSEVESKRRLIERIGKQYVVVDYASPNGLVPLLMYRYASDCDP